MIGQRYIEKKTAVLDVLKRYRSFRGNTDDGVDPAFLEQRAKALEEGRYVLAVVGETKAGKSTLINALLGERILPTDVLQSSSAIVEIFKSEKKFVKVTYADGHSETKEDDPATPDVDEAYEHLRRIASIQDHFRSIPTTLIDAYIVQGRIETGQPIPFEELKEKSMLPLVGKESLIEEYVKGRTLADIPVEISFGFPLKYAFDELRLVDSPGVNARGGVQDRTFAYLHHANAVLFVHSLEESVEKSSFHDFITEVIPNRTKQSLFLVLSKSGTKSEIEIEEKINEARSLFSHEFDADRILHVDSMLNIISIEMQGFDSPVALKNHYIERKRHFNQRFKAERDQGELRDEAVNYDTKLRLLNIVLENVGNVVDCDAVCAELRRLSNFEQMEQEIERFSARAPELQLSELLAAVKRGYDNQVVAHEQDIDMNTKKVKHPQTFANEISEQQRLLKEYQSLMNDFVKRIESEYTGTKASCRQELEKLKMSYIEQIEGASGERWVKKALADFHDANCSFVDNVATELGGQFRVELQRRGEEFKTEHSITVPTVDIAGIEANAKKNAYREAEVEREPRGFWEKAFKYLTLGIKKYKEKKNIFDPSKFLKNYKSSATSVVEKTVSDDSILISNLLEQFKKSFKKSLASLIDTRSKALEEIKVRQSANDETLNEIKVAERKKKDIEKQIDHIIEILEDLR